MRIRRKAGEGGKSEKCALEPVGGSARIYQVRYFLLFNPSSTVSNKFHPTKPHLKNGNTAKTAMQRQIHKHLAKEATKLPDY